MSSRPAHDDSQRPKLQLLRGGQARQPSPSLDDAEILESVRRGVTSAATALYDRVRPVIDRTLLRLLGRRDREHDELAQLALIELVQSFARFRGECSLDTWTARITSHVTYKALRRRRLERRWMSPEAGEDPASAVDLDRDAGHRRVLARVRAHLESMDETRSWTVVLHDVCGHDLREIAEITEVSVAAAQSRLVRGRRELHERLAADPELADALADRRGP